MHRKHATERDDDATLLAEVGREKIPSRAPLHAALYSSCMHYLQPRALLLLLLLRTLSTTRLALLSSFLRPADAQVLLFVDGATMLSFNGFAQSSGRSLALLCIASGGRWCVLGEGRRFFRSFCHCAIRVRCNLCNAALIYRCGLFIMLTYFCYIFCYFFFRKLLSSL